MTHAASALEERREELAELYAPVAAPIAEVEQILARELRSRYPFITELVEHSTSLRGKRLRPMLLLLTAQACGAVRREHLVLAAVVEMIHTATLVHDDVLDEADTRRHRATVNARWNNETSVLLGDYLFTHAFSLASSLDSTLACRLIGRATNIVCEGELQQIHHRGDFRLGEREYFGIINAKTAELCACSCRIGAHFSGASARVEEAMERYGRCLGMAFQIADDLLDVIGDEREAGKSLGTDLQKQKLTLPIIRLLERAPRDSRAEVERILAGPGNHKRDALEPYLAATDSIAYARRRAQEFAQQARAELTMLTESSAALVLQRLTHFVVSRRR